MKNPSCSYMNLGVWGVGAGGEVAAVLLSCLRQYRSTGIIIRCFVRGASVPDTNNEG